MASVSPGGWLLVCGCEVVHGVRLLGVQVGARRWTGGLPGWRSLGCWGRWVAWLVCVVVGGALRWRVRWSACLRWGAGACAHVLLGGSRTRVTVVCMYASPCA